MTNISADTAAERKRCVDIARMFADENIRRELYR